MESLEINATQRESHGRSEVRRLRTQGRVPAIVYGDKDKAEMISVSHNDLMRHLESEAFYSQILKLKVDGKEQRVVLREVQRHPTLPKVLHLDLMRIAEDRKLVMNVPLHFMGEEQCIGVKQQGGVVAHLVTEIEISCLPKDLPESLELDISELELGASFHLSDIKLPEGVSIPSLERSEDLDTAVVNVFKPKVIEEEPVVTEAEEGEEAAAEEAKGEGEGEAAAASADGDKDKDKDKKDDSDDKDKKA